MDEDKPIDYSGAGWRPDQEDKPTADEIIREIRAQKEEKSAFQKLKEKYGLRKIILTTIICIFIILLIYLTIDHFVKVQSFKEYKETAVNDLLEKTKQPYIVKDIVSVLGTIISIEKRTDYDCIYVKTDETEKLCLMMSESIEDIENKVGSQVDARCEMIRDDTCKVYSITAITILDDGYLADLTAGEI